MPIQYTAPKKSPLPATYGAILQPAARVKPAPTAVLPTGYTAPKYVAAPDATVVNLNPALPTLYPLKPTWDEDTALYHTVAKKIATDYKVPVKNIQDIMAATAYHESTWTPDSLQTGGGPGRGAYQFELNSVPTAANRLATYLTEHSLPVPAWVEPLRTAATADASKLTPAQQNLLFLGEHYQKGTSPFKGAAQGTVPIVEWWAKGHQTTGENANKEKFLADLNIALQKRLPNFLYIPQ
jgi:hypothetical protein